MTKGQISRNHAALLASLDLTIDQVSDPAVYGASAPTVSQWSVKDHLEHLTIANKGITSWIERALEGDPELDSGGSPTLVGRIVLLVGAIPRGRAKAPERVVPKGTTAEELLADSYRLRERVEALGSSLSRLQAATATRNHFAFGDLNAAQWLRFMVIHDHHHQKIVRDVLAAASG